MGNELADEEAKTASTMHPGKAAGSWDFSVDWTMAGRWVELPDAQSPNEEDIRWDSGTEVVWAKSGPAVFGQLHSLKGKGCSPRYCCPCVFEGETACDTSSFLHPHTSFLFSKCCIKCISISVVWKKLRRNSERWTLCYQCLIQDALSFYLYRW